LGFFVFKTKLIGMSVKANLVCPNLGHRIKDMIRNSKVLPSEKHNCEEVKKFAGGPYFFFSKAYSFVR